MKTVTVYMDKFILAFYGVMAVLAVLMGVFYYSALDLKTPDGFLKFTKALFALIIIVIFMFMVMTTNKLDRLGMNTTK
jgi:hypothetical protein